MTYIIYLWKFYSLTDSLLKLSFEGARRLCLFLYVSISIEQGTTTRQRQRGGGLIANKVGNVSLERGVS